jgi:hypothetical protein
MNFNDIDKKTFKKNVTKCLGHHYAIWTSDSNFLLAQTIFFGPAKGWPSFQALVTGHLLYLRL